MRGALVLGVLLLLVTVVWCHDPAPPGKPALIGCRSPDKETFTCWWEPGSPGGLPTDHRLFYKKNSEVVRECPDYISGGSHSCHFDKSHTSLWEEYELTVVATNALGNATSKMLRIDVMYVVRPYPPKNVVVRVKQSNDNPYLFIGWQSPLNKTKMVGWVTIRYQLRVKPEKSKEWKMYNTELQMNLSLHTVDPGVTYEVEVRCALDHSSWSEWSSTASIKIPNTSQKDKLLWVLMLVSLIPLLTAVCVLVVKRKTVKQWLLPPVPGPKIVGVDPKLLKSGRSEDVVSALFSNQKLANMTARTEENEEFISVSDCREWLLLDECLSEKVRSLIIPNGFLFNSITQSNDLEKAEDGKEDPVLDRSFSRHLASELQSPSVSKDAASRSTAGQCPPPSYVDIPPPKERQTPEATPDDYSRVNGVDGVNVLLEKEQVPLWPDAQIQLANMASDYSRVAEMNSDATVLLQKLSADPFCKEKQHHDAGWTVGKKPKPPEVSKGSCTQLVGSGYVDSVPEFC